MNISQLRSKYKNEIEIIREKIHEKKLFISLSAIDEIIGLLEKLNLKKRREIQDAYLEKLLDYSIKFCESADERLIKESYIKKADLEINKIEIDLIKKIQSIEEIEMIEKEKPSEVVKSSQEILDISSSEKTISISHLRSKYKREIEIIRKKVQTKDLFINLSGIDELISLFESLSLKERSETLDAYLEKLLEYAIKFCENADESLINERHIKQAILDVDKIEVDLMRKVIATQGVELIEKEKQPEEPETLQEIAEVPTPEEQPEEFEFIQEEEVTSKFEEIPIEEETIHEELAVSIPKKELEELIPPTPQISNCPFCGLVKSEAAVFCPQCGMIFKK